MNKLIHKHLQVATVGDNRRADWERLISELNKGWQIVSAVESNTIINYVLLAPYEADD